jgi:hypothetical protein
METASAPTDPAAARARLRQILLERSIHFGDFTLTSGA